MSKAKMDAYKEYKKNRKKILKKEHNKKVFAGVMIKLVGLLVVAGIITLIAFWGIKKYNAYKESLPNYDSETFILQDINGVNETDAATDAKTEEASETTKAEETTEVSETTKAEQSTEAETVAEK